LGLLAVAFLAGLGAREVASQVSVAASRLILPYLRITGGSATLAQEGLFLPAAGRLGFSVGGTSQWEIDQSGDLVTTADNADSIGNVAGLRPANAYFGTAVAVGDDPASAGSFRIASAGSLQARNKTGTGNIILVTTDLAETLILASGSSFVVVGATTSAPNFRLPSDTGALQARNAAGTGTVDLIKKDAANTVILASTSPLTISVASASPPVNTGIKLLCVSATTGKIYFGNTWTAAFGCGS